MKQYIIDPLPDIEYSYLNNTKLSKEIFSNHIQADGTWHKINVFDDTDIKIALRHTTDKGFNFERIDALILDAIGTLYDNGIYFFTTDMVAKVIYQNNHHRTTAKVIQTIQNRFNLMMGLNIRVNIENEHHVRQSVPKDKRLMKSTYTYFLPIKTIEAVFSANNKHGLGYHLYESPLLWEYAKYTKQIVKCSFGSFRLPKQNMTIESLLILRYIHRRIETMKNPNNNLFNHKICLYRIENKVPKGLLAECGIDPFSYRNWSDKHRKICRLIESFLERLKTADDKTVRIKNYKHYKTNSGEGYHIDLYSRFNKSYKN